MVEWGLSPCILDVGTVWSVTRLNGFKLGWTLGPIWTVQSVEKSLVLQGMENLSFPIPVYSLGNNLIKVSSDPHYSFEDISIFRFLSGRQKITPEYNMLLIWPDV